MGNDIYECLHNSDVCLHLPIQVYEVTTSRRRQIASMCRRIYASTFADEAFIPMEHNIARMEMDNHADTC